MLIWRPRSQSMTVLVIGQVPATSRPPAQGVQRPPQKIEGAQDLLKKVRE